MSHDQKRENEDLLRTTLEKHLKGRDAPIAADRLCKAVLGEEEDRTLPFFFSGNNDWRDLDVSLIDDNDDDGGKGRNASGGDERRFINQLEEAMSKAADNGGSAVVLSFFRFFEKRDWDYMTKHDLVFAVRHVSTDGEAERFLIQRESDCQEEEINKKIPLGHSIRAVSLLSMGEKSVGLLDMSVSSLAGECYKFFRYLRDPREKTEIIEALNKTTEPLRQNDSELDYVKGLVQVTSNGAPFNDDSLFLGGGKRNVLVIGGESGSGKTWYAAYGFQKSVPRLYLEIEAADLGQDGETLTGPPKSKEKWKNTELVAKLRKSANSLEEQSEPLFATAKEALHRSCTSLHEDRHMWVKKLLNKKIGKLKENGNAGADWFLGHSPVQLEHFLLVVDEVGRDKDLLHGLIDYGVTYLKETLGNKVKMVGLVLAGTSLDDLYRDSSELPLAGSNPEKVKVVVMEAASVDCLEKADKLESMSAPGVMDGLYSAPFSTNVRIQVLMLRPFFESVYGSHREKDKTKARYIQAAKGSSYTSMAFIPPTYCSYSGLRGKDVKKKEKLFKVAFCTMLFASIVGESETSDLTQVLRFLYDRLTLEDKEEAKLVGLVTTLPEHTTKALKLLACKGLAAPVIKGNGASLEFSLSLSLVRQLDCAGFLCRTYTLQGAWPPPWTSKPKGADDVPAMELTKPHFQDLRVIHTFLSGEANRAIVLIQGAPNAQGPDVMVLRPSLRASMDVENQSETAFNLSLDSLNDSVSQEDCEEDQEAQGAGTYVINGKYILDLYQAKNLSVSPTVDAMTRTLGVVFSNEKLVTEIQPKTGVHFSALYSANAIDQLCSSLNVSVGDRVVVKPNGTSTAFPQGRTKLWTRDHLEPSFSIFGDSIAPKG